MKNLELSDEEEAVLAVELVQLISRATYPFSDRVRTLGAILNKLRPEPAPPAPPPPKRYEPRPASALAKGGTATVENPSRSRCRR